MKNRILIVLFLLSYSVWAQSAPLQTASTQTGSAQPSPCDKDGSKAPAMFLVRIETTAGAFVIETHKDWAPIGVDRFYQLACAGFFDDSRFFRVVPKFVVQFGVAGNPRVNDFWRTFHIQDDPVKKNNKRGFVTFAMALG